MKLAVTRRACVMFTEQLPLPLHVSFQPSKELLPVRLAMSVTEVPHTKVAEQVPEVPRLARRQSIPAGFDVTTPPPFPSSTTVSV